MRAPEKRPDCAPTPDILDIEREVPAEALLVSLLALVVASLASLLWPEGMRAAGALVWILAFVPPFLLAYHKGWRGAAAGLTIGMGALVCLQIVPDLLSSQRVDFRITGVITVVLIAVSLGAGWLAESLKRDHRVALQLAYYDALTGLPNRRLVEMHLDLRFADAQRLGRPLSVAMFDLDALKRFNDRHGHAAGDWALRLVAQALARSTRRMDISGRIGGDEFLTVLAGDLETARAFEQRVRDAILGATGPLTGGPVTFSSGLATFEHRMTAPDQLVAAADRALYAAKRAAHHAGRPPGPGREIAEGGEEDVVGAVAAGSVTAVG